MLADGLNNKNIVVQSWSQFFNNIIFFIFPEVEDVEKARQLFIQKLGQCTRVFDFAVDPLSSLKLKEVWIF